MQAWHAHVSGLNNVPLTPCLNSIQRRDVHFKDINIQVAELFAGKDPFCTVEIGKPGQQLAVNYPLPIILNPMEWRDLLSP
jgi:hypothetical protein